MSDRSAIEWTEATWNPVTGCSKVSTGCDNCYAEAFAERFRGVRDHPYEQGFDLRLWPSRLDQPTKWRRPRMIFVNSMSDLFHEDVPDGFIAAILEVIEATPRHTYQVLTKRPGRMASVLKRLRPTPLPNLWLGTSIESNKYTWRADKLRETSAAVRFLSVEPLLGPLPSLDLDGIGWVIVGGESGPRHRPIDAAWVLAIRDLCESRHVPFFFKQWGGLRPKSGGRELEGRTWDEMPSTERVLVAP
jgi:protein gp37